MINQNGTKMFFLHVLRYALATSCRIIRVFYRDDGRIFISRDELRIDSVRPAFSVLLFFSVYVLNRLSG